MNDMSYSHTSLSRDLQRAFFDPTSGAQRFSILRCIQLRAEDKPLDGLERELSDEARAGSPTEAHVGGANFYLPYLALVGNRRDLVSGTPSAGGNLIGMAVAAPVVALQPYSVAVRAGFQVLDGLRQNVSVPATRSDDTALEPTWIDFQVTSATPVTPVTGVTTMKPHFCAKFAKYSRQLEVTCPPVVLDKFLSTLLARSVGIGIDRAVMSGRSGSFGAVDMLEPIGLTASSGVDNRTGSDAAIVTGEVQEYVTARRGSDVDCGFIAGPLARRLLINSWGQERDVLLARPAHCSAGLATGSIAYGPWGDAYLGLWGDGISVEVDPYTSFRTGQVTMRAIAAVDVAFADPSAFSVGEIG